MNKLVSDHYAKQLSQLHNIRKSFGGSSSYKHINEWLANNKCHSVLDYGCGKGNVFKNIQKKFPLIDCRGYDPGVPEYAVMPEIPAELVICADVLEHIEPELIDNVLKHIESLTLKTAYLIIDTRPAHKNLPDGRNAHLIIEDQDWWTNKILTVTNFKIKNNIFWKNKRVSMECVK